MLFLTSFQNMALNWWTEQLLEFHAYILVEITTNNRWSKKSFAEPFSERLNDKLPYHSHPFDGESRRPNSNGNLGSKLPVGWPSSIATGKLATNWGAWWLGFQVRRVEVVSVIGNCSREQMVGLFVNGIANAVFFLKMGVWDFLYSTGKNVVWGLRSKVTRIWVIYLQDSDFFAFGRCPYLKNNDKKRVISLARNPSFCPTYPLIHLHDNKQTRKYTTSIYIFKKNMYLRTV